MGIGASARVKYADFAWSLTENRQIQAYCEGMNQSAHPTFADRLADRGIAMLAAANALFFAAFLFVALLACGPARAAEAAACGGKDIFAEIKAKNPEIYARIEAEAAATPNGTSRLWKVEKAGLEPSYLFGTMHLTDARVTTLTPEAQRAFDASRTVVIETTDVLDEKKAAMALMSRPDLTMFTDATTLDSLMSAQDRAIVEAGLKERGIPLASVQKMKPWLISSMIALPACELQRKQIGVEILDIKLARDAETAGKDVTGLETMVGQIEAMSSLPVSLHMKGLVETMKLGERLEDMFETMIVLYVRGDTGTIWPLFRNLEVPGVDNDAAGYAEFEEAMINNRNVTMADNAEPIMAKGTSFIAVGALHLPGEKGLVEMLRQRGYTLTALE
jgi:uncharacterized protein YbaP (TraB family)